MQPVVTSTNWNLAGPIPQAIQEITSCQIDDESSNMLTQLQIGFILGGNLSKKILGMMLSNIRVFIDILNKIKRSLCTKQAYFANSHSVNSNSTELNSLWCF